MAKIAEILANNSPTISYEFFPPKGAAQAANLERTIGSLAATEPDFISITYGALGSTRETTRDIAIEQNRQLPFPVMAHLTCAGQTRSDIMKLLAAYEEGGLENILALRGDGQPGDIQHAIDLVELIKNRHPSMSVGVAAHPEGHPNSPSLKTDRQHLAEKLQAADFAITQFFFDAGAYYRLVEQLDTLDCRKPVIPGIMLFASAVGLKKMAELNNTAIPEGLTTALDGLTNPQDIGKLALDTAIELAHDLRDQGAPGLHVYTLNRSQPAVDLVTNLAI